MMERIFHRFIELLRGNWVPLLLFATLYAVIAQSIDTANWVDDDAVFLTAINMGLLFGYLLARSRFRGWFAFVYLFVIAAVTAIEVVGHILPSLFQLFSTPFVETTRLMNLRAFELYLRVEGWIEILRGDGTIEDTGLFIMLICVLLVLSLGWLVWWYVRRRSALVGILPIGVLVAINMQLSQQPLLSYAVFLMTALLLIARNAFNRQMEDWTARRVDFPEQLGIEWSAVAVGLALAIALMARAAPWVGTPQGWQAIADLLEPYQEETSETAEKFFGGVNTPPPDYQKPEIFVNTPNMSVIGAPIPLGYETVMWVTTSDPPPPSMPEYGPPVPVTNTIIHYWRSGILGAYNGRGWEAVPMQEEVSVRGSGMLGAMPEEAPEGRYYLRQTFVMEARHRGVLFSVNEPVRVGEGAALRATTPDGSQLIEGQAETYEVFSLATKVSANQLAAAPTEYPEEIRAAYLQLPEGLPNRVRALAGRVAGNALDPYHTAINIQTYLRVTFPYDLSAQPTPEGRDLVDYFLFDLQKGFCSHYASAMVVMLRTQGIPARVVTGYAMGDYNEERGAYRVPVASSHAWVEVYFPGYGWIEFEPTAYRPAIEYREEGPSTAGNAVPLQNEQRQQRDVQPLTIALLALGALLLLALPVMVLRVFTGGRSAPEAQVDLMYRQMRRALGWAGLVAVSSVTPDEYLIQYREQLAPYGKLHQALGQVTALYRELTYSPHKPDAARVRSASRLWQSSLREWVVLWGKAAWQRLRRE